MSFQYSEKYFGKHFSSLFYRRYISMRNKFIKNEITKYVSSGKLLEAGFGDDNLLKIFKNDFNIFGVDISEFAVKEIIRKYSSAHFKICNVSKEEIPFDEKFDVICAINTVEHFENPEFALQNISHSLVRDGVFAAYLPTQSNIFSRLQYRILYDVEEHLFRPSIASLKDTLRRLGFKLIKEYAGRFIPLKISTKLIIESLNLYFGLFEKQGRLV